MTKMTQCGRCRIGDGVHCLHYKPTDDSDCAYYEYGEEEKGKDISPFKNRVVNITKWVAGIVIGSCLIFIPNVIIASLVAFSLLFVVFIGIMIYMWKK